METFLPTAMRRFASTFFVLIAMFVASVGAVQATPCLSHAADTYAEEQAFHAMVGDDDATTLDADSTLPSIEDNGGGLDDTFDLPPDYIVTLPRQAAVHLAGIVPAPHAHHPSLDLRPPIA